MPVDHDDRFGISAHDEIGAVAHHNHLTFPLADRQVRHDQLEERTARQVVLRVIQSAGHGSSGSLSTRAPFIVALEVHL